MNKPAAIEGSLVDCRNVALNKSLRLLIDVPAERGAEIVKMFGWPTQAAPVPVVVARMAETPQIEATAAPANTNGHRSWGELSPAQQAGIRCAEPAFQKFLREEGDSAVSDTEGAAAYVRLVCGVHSRAHLTGHAANLWHGLDARFQTWMHTA